MTDTLAALSDALRNDAETLRVIGQNVANMDTVAYRREIAVQHTSFEAVAEEARASAAAAPAFATQFDQRPGTLRSTGEALHFALEGAGFFVVDAPGGEALTRRGDFRVDTEGRLVTQAGLPVLGKLGAIALDGAAPAIGADGGVRVNGALIDTLRIAQVASETQLTALGGDLYRAAQLDADSGAVRVRQGFLESSNVAPVEEMVRLMETMRHFETLQRFVRGYDDMTGKAISELGRI
jgi:flagellar basal-body rod protein FlgF